MLLVEGFILACLWCQSYLEVSFIQVLEGCWLPASILASGRVSMLEYSQCPAHLGKLGSLQKWNRYKYVHYLNTGRGLERLT